jgi:hypothetical protein
MDPGVKPTLHLPKNLKDRILTDQRLTLHHKFVLFTLYYLDSKGKLGEFGRYIPHFLNLNEKDFKKSMDELARHNYLRLENESVFLNVRPLRYNAGLSS